MDTILETTKTMTNYTIGRALEYKIINLLKENLPAEKYTVIRTAGSHSPVDILITEHRNRKCCGIQCKSKKDRGGSMKTIIDELPFTTEALVIYIEEAKKRVDFLKSYVSEFNKLKNRLKIAQDRLSGRIKK